MYHYYRIIIIFQVDISKNFKKSRDWFIPHLNDLFKKIEKKCILKDLFFF